MTETPKLYSVKLTADELLTLDGHCTPSVQGLVDQMKEARSMMESGLRECVAAMIASVVAQAEKDGRLVFRRQSITRCPCCSRSDGYYPVKRSSRYKRRGQPDFDRPKTFSGYELRHSRVSFKHSISRGFCESCLPEALPALTAALADTKAEIPEKLTGIAPRWKWQQKRLCTKCGWTGHEGEMVRERTLVGDGWYPAKCPKCGAGGGFSNAVKIADGFDLIACEP